jgi:ribosome-associated protein
MNDDLVVTRSVRIPRSELQVSFAASGGPGGQHANRSNTRVDLRFDVRASAAFSEVQRARVMERLGTEVRVVVDDERSQTRNRALAEERLVARVQSALHVDRPRKKTKPTRGSQRRRLDTKSRRGEVKRQRRKPSHDD